MPETDLRRRFDSLTDHSLEATFVGSLVKGLAEGIGCLSEDEQQQALRYLARILERDLFDLHDELRAFKEQCWTS